MVSGISEWLWLSVVATMGLLALRVVWVLVLRRVLKAVDGEVLELTDVSLLQIDPQRDKNIISAFIIFEEALDAAQQERVRETLRLNLVAAVPKLRRRVVSSRLGHPRLLPMDPAADPAASSQAFLRHWFVRNELCDGIDLDASHHQRQQNAGDGDDSSGSDGGEAIRTLLAQLVSQPLHHAFTGPMWEFHLVPRFRHSQLRAARSAMLFRIHHCLGDGLSILRYVLDSIEWDRALSPPLSRPPRAVAAAGRPVSMAERLGPVAQLLSPMPSRAAFFRNAAARSAGPPAVRWFALNRSVEELKALGRFPGRDYSINEVLLAALAGALRSWTEEVPTMLMWVSLMPPSHMYYPPQHPGIELPTGMSNANLAFVILRLPVHLPSFRERLDDICRQGRRHLASPATPLSNWSSRVIAVLPDWVALPILLQFGSKGTISCSNVPGPQFPLFIGGAKLDTLVFWVPPQAGPALFTNIISYNGRVTVGMIGPRCLLSDSHIDEAFEAQMQELSELHTHPSPASG